MCGIAGIYRWGDRRDDGEDRRRVRAMVRALAHRGPDGDGVTDVGHGLVLGHARLSIIDLSTAARQPMLSADGRHHLTYNGELYNFVELRGQLASEGARFDSHGDSEVLLRALEVWGDAALDRIDGMFAFAHFDGGERRLLLARDRCGKKPLFVAFEQGAVVFASELAALRAGGVHLELDEAALGDHLVRGYVPPPRTLCRGVSQLAPAEAMTISASGVVRRRAYWHHPWLRDGGPRGPKVVHADVAVEGIQRLFRAAVARRLAADVPLGAFLSGGVDSTAVVAEAQRAAGTALQTFTIGFEDAPAWDERAAARSTAALLGTRHVEEIARPDVIEMMPLIVERSGEPQGDSSLLPTYMVCRLARRHVTVALSGDGGDELFAGYDRFLLAVMAARAPRAPAERLAQWFAHAEEGPASGRLSRALRRWSRAAAHGPAATLMEWAGGSRVEDVARLLRRPLSARELAAPEAEALAVAKRGNAPDLQAALAANFITYLPGNTLVKLDRASMVNSLEVRSPFLDVDLVDFAATVAPSLLVRGLSLKWILKRALAALVPGEVLRRRKGGFGAPVDDWFRGDRGVALRDALLRPGSSLEAHLPAEGVRTLLRDHVARTANHGILLSRLLALQVWLDWAKRAPEARTDDELPRTGASP